MDTKDIDIKEIAKKIDKSGGQLYLVGGAVRDKILKRKNNDEDYCVTGLDSDEFLKLFPIAKPRGNFFEVYEIDGREFAMARQEKKNNNSDNGHTNFTITTQKSITIEDDLARRDITINSIAENVLTGELVDPYNGIADLQSKKIKATTDAFKEDPLRVYRVARQAAQLEFNVDSKTIELMSSMKKELDTISGERVFKELRKALNTNYPSVFFQILKKANLLDVHFKEINNLIGVDQGIKYHPEGDAFNHTMQVVDFTANEIRKNSKKNKLKDEIIFSALVHDLGKGVTPKDQYPHHYDHDKNGIDLVVDLGNRIKIPTSWIKSGKTICKEHMRGGKYSEMKSSSQVTFIENISKTMLGIEGLQMIVNADKISRVSISTVENNIIYNAKRYIDFINEKYDQVEIRKKKMDFSVIGKKCMNEINGRYIIKKYGEIDGKCIKSKLHEERINLVKNLQMEK